MDGLWRRVGQSASQKSCVKSQNKKSAQAAIVEDRRRAKSPDVLAHRLSHLHNSHQGVGLGFFPLQLALFYISKNRKLPVSRYIWCNVVMLDCRLLSFYCGFCRIKFLLKNFAFSCKMCIILSDCLYACIVVCIVGWAFHKLGCLLCLKVDWVRPYHEINLSKQNWQ